MVLLGPDQPGAPADSASTTTAATAELSPVDVDTPPVTELADALCPGLIGGLPLTLQEQPARPVRSASAYTAAWGEPPVVLVCGVDRPTAFVAGTPDLVQINGVAWFAEPGPATTQWTAVDRGVYVGVSVPTALNSAPIADLSSVVAQTLPVQPVTPAPS